MKRFLLIGAVMGILLTALLASSGTANAQSYAQQQTTHAAYSDTYFFNAGWWGWGLCIGHSDLQSLYNWSSARLLISATVAGRVSSWQVQAAGIALWIYIASVKARDQGRGVCVAWPFYLPSIASITWSR